MLRRSEPTARWLPPAGSIVSRLAAFAIVWWALTEGDSYNLWLGGIVVIVATLASIALQPVTLLRPWHLLTLLPYFIRESITGGIDVARRACVPDMPLDPGFIEVPVRIPHGTARVFLACIMNLTPGTVSVEIFPNHLRIHMLDQGMPIEGRIRAMEDRTARLFGIKLGEPAGE